MTSDPYRVKDKYRGPPMAKSLKVTSEQNKVIYRAIEALRDSETGCSRDGVAHYDLSVGQALEMICWEYLSGAGAPPSPDLPLDDPTPKPGGDRAVKGAPGRPCARCGKPEQEHSGHRGCIYR